MAWPIPSLADSASTKPAWTASAQVYAKVHGKWKLTRTVASLSELRGQMTVRGAELTGNDLRATMAIMHLSWQGSRKVIMPPTVVVHLRTEMISKHTEVFEGTATVPTILPVFWSVVVS